MRRWPLLLLLAACGDVVVATAHRDDDVLGPSLGRTPASVVDEPCATATLGAACTNAPDECELGDAAAIECNTRIACNGFRWVPARTAASDCGIVEDPTERKTCGPRTEVASDAADAESDAADAADAESDAEAGSDAEAADADVPDAGDQACVTAPEGCPRVRPHVGLRCVVPMTCDYGACAIVGGRAMECVGELWHVAETRCPR